MGSDLSVFVESLNVALTVWQREVIARLEEFSLALRGTTTAFESFASAVEVGSAREARLRRMHHLYRMRRVR